MIYLKDTETLTGFYNLVSKKFSFVNNFLNDYMDLISKNILKKTCSWNHDMLQWLGLFSLREKLSVKPPYECCKFNLSY